MRKALYILALGFALTGCDNNKKDDGVVSQRYVHKYGYAVSKDEFESRGYPGQKITLLKTGVTITASYENGTLHGVSTHTYPNSQTIESYYVYNQGNLTKEILYDPAGMPLREHVQLSPTRYTVTSWYTDGTPMRIEEYANEELLDGQYMTTANEIESRVEKGRGQRICRDTQGMLLYRDQIDEGYITKREAFFPNGNPESIAYYFRNQLNGEKSTFTASGEPIATKEYVNGKLHGKSTFFKNGTRDVEISYLDGQKNGLEIHYLDGEAIAQEILWENDKKHGPCKYYVDGIAYIDYYYNGSLVSEEKWNELDRIDHIIGQISPEVRL